jgi:hypothetical protein
MHRPLSSPTWQGCLALGGELLWGHANTSRRIAHSTAAARCSSTGDADRWHTPVRHASLASSPGRHRVTAQPSQSPCPACLPSSTRTSPLRLWERARRSRCGRRWHVSAANRQSAHVRPRAASTVTVTAGAATQFASQRRSAADSPSTLAIPFITPRSAATSCSSSMSTLSRSKPARS